MKKVLIGLIIFIAANSFDAYGGWLHGGWLKNEYEVASDTGNPQTPVRVPEGVAFDIFTGNFFATSIFGGKVSRINGFTGAETVFYQEQENIFLSFSGIEVDPIRRMVYFCATDLVSNPGSPSGSVYAVKINYRQNGGSLKRVFDFPAPFFCNDLTLDLRGNVYVTNSLGAEIYKIPSEAYWNEYLHPFVFASSPRFLPDFGAPIVLGLNGIAVTPSNSHLMVAKSVPPELFKINLHDPFDIEEVAFTGDQFGVNPDPNGDPIRFLAPDGIVFRLNHLYVIYHGAVQKLSFNDWTFSSAEVSSTVNVPTGLSTATRAYGGIYVIDSEVTPVTQPQLGLPIVLPHKILKLRLWDFE